MLDHVAESVVLKTPLAAEPVNGKAAPTPVVRRFSGWSTSSISRDHARPEYVSSFFTVTVGTLELDGMDFRHLDGAGLVDDHIWVLCRPRACRDCTQS